MAGSERPGGEDKAAEVRAMFSDIAPRYDLLNHVLSLNLDRGWRRAAITALLGDGRCNGVFVDACAGTLDLAHELAARSGFQGRVVAADFALPMLALGAAKVADLPVYPVCADATKLPIGDGCAAGVVVGFGIRNLASIDEGLAEFARVLAPGGRLVVLEFTVPRTEPVRSAYLFYFRRILPRIGRLVSGHDTAYEYLPSSVLEFPTPDDLARRMESVGFRAVSWRALGGGIVCLHQGERLQDTAAGRTNGAAGWR